MTLLNYLPETIKARIPTAHNMVSIEQDLSNITAHYLNEYAEHFCKCPTGKGMQAQLDWSKKAVTHYAYEIRRDKLEVIALIPERLHNCMMYKKIIAEMA